MVASLFKANGWIEPAAVSPAATDARVWIATSLLLPDSLIVTALAEMAEEEGFEPPSELPR